MRIIIFFLLILSYNNAASQTEITITGANYCNTGDWELVFGDEFDGTTINTDKWYTYRPPWGNNSIDDCETCRTHGDRENQILKWKYFL